MSHTGPFVADRLRWGAADAARFRDDGPATLDPQKLQELRQLDPTGSQDLLRRVMVTYQQSMGRLLDEARAAVGGADWVAVHRVAHTLKSPSAAVGASDLTAWCVLIEHAVRENRLEEVPGLLDRLLAEGRRVDQAVRQLLDG